MMRMKLLYLANIRFPTERAHGIQIAQMCHAFTQAGAEVELVVQRRVSVLHEDAFTYYDLPKSFQITELRTFDTLQYAWTGLPGRVSYILQTLIFALHVLWYVLRTPGVVYSRDEALLYLLSFLGRPFSYEIHAPKWNFVTRRVVQRAALLFPISQGLKDFYIEKGIAPERLLVAPDAVNLNQFNIPDGRETCRKRLGLPLNRKIVLYAGHLYERKGAFVVGEAAPLLDNNVLVLFVGGTDHEIPNFTKRFGNDSHILILGPKPYAEIPYYLRAADVLVLPNSSKDADARIYTSPMKLFEYMSSGIPIVASHVSSLREILDERMAYFFIPDDPRSLASELAHVLTHSQEADEKAKDAREQIKNHTWEKRAKNIINALLAVTNSIK